jgi:hypothetical protein
MVADRNTQAFYDAVALLETNNIPIESFIRRLFAEPHVNSRPIVTSLIGNVSRILDILFTNHRTHDAVSKWIGNTYIGTLQEQITTLSKPSSGYHFVANKATAKELKKFTIAHLAQGIRELAPDVWELVGRLLQADPDILKRREKVRNLRERARQEGGGYRKRKPRREVEDDEDEMRLFDIADEDEDEPEHIEELLENQTKSLTTVVSVLLNISTQMNDYSARNKLRVSVS